MQAELLKGLKVIELSTVLAGPSAASFLGELGARVIKIEPPGGDVTRSWKLPSEKGPASAYFYSANWAKEYLTLDLRSGQGKTDFLALVQDADILLANFKPGSAEKLGVDHKSLHTINPKLIYVNLLGYSAEDDSPAFDLIVQAETGFMYMNGTAESGPVKMPVALMDVIAAHQLKESILLALYRRATSGQGCYAEVSLFKSGLSGLANQAANFLNESVIAERAGSLHPNIAPYGEILLTKDHKQIVLAIGNDAQFGSLCKVLGKEELKADVRFSSNPERVVHRKVLLPLLNEAAAGMEGDILLRQLKEAAVPAAFIANLEQVFAHPLSKEMIWEEETEGKPSRRVRGAAFKLYGD